MSALLEGITPETAEKLLAESKAQGLSVDDYLKSILPKNGDEGHSKQISMAEIDSILDELSKGTDAPALPEDFSRADIYSDHD